MCVHPLPRTHAITRACTHRHPPHTCTLACPQGNVGAISRPGRSHVSCACGALNKALVDIRQQGLTANCKQPGGEWWAGGRLWRAGRGCGGVGVAGV